MVKSLTHSLLLWHQMMFFAKWFLCVCRTSYDLLLQFPLFMHSKLKQSFWNEHCWPAKHLWETILEQKFHQHLKCFSRERVHRKLFLFLYTSQYIWFFCLVCLVLILHVKQVSFFFKPTNLHHFRVLLGSLLHRLLEEFDYLVICPHAIRNEAPLL